MLFAVNGDRTSDAVRPGSLESPRPASDSPPSVASAPSSQLPGLVKRRGSQQLHFALARKIRRDLQHVHSAPRQQRSRKKLRRASPLRSASAAGRSHPAPRAAPRQQGSPMVYSSAPISAVRIVPACALATQTPAPSNAAVNTIIVSRPERITAMCHRLLRHSIERLDQQRSIHPTQSWIFQRPPASSLISVLPQDHSTEPAPE